MVYTAFCKQLSVCWIPGCIYLKKTQSSLAFLLNISVPTIPSTLQHAYVTAEMYKAW